MLPAGRRLLDVLQVSVGGVFLPDSCRCAGFCCVPPGLVHLRLDHAGSCRLPFLLANWRPSQPREGRKPEGWGWVEGVEYCNEVEITRQVPWFEAPQVSQREFLEGSALFAASSHSMQQIFLDLNKCASPVVFQCEQSWLYLPSQTPSCFKQELEAEGVSPDRSQLKGSSGLQTSQFGGASDLAGSRG